MDREVTISITAGTVVKTLVILALAWLLSRRAFIVPLPGTRPIFLP